VDCNYRWTHYDHHYRRKSTTEVTLVHVNVIDAWYGVVMVTIGFVVLVLWPLPRSTAKTQ
jgi:hypothetical protein